jgi:hypothetical protein
MLPRPIQIQLPQVADLYSEFRATITDFLRNAGAPDALVRRFTNYLDEYRDDIRSRFYQAIERDAVYRDQLAELTPGSDEWNAVVVSILSAIKTFVVYDTQYQRIKLIFQDADDVDFPIFDIG